jgi:hypothetical protein
MLWPRLEEVEGHVVDVATWTENGVMLAAVIEDTDDYRYLFVYEWEFHLPEHLWGGA